MPVLLSRRVDHTHRDGSQFAITITNMLVAECQSSWSRYPRDCTRLVARAVTPMHPRLPPTLGPHCTVPLSPMMRAALEKPLRRTIVVSRRRLACIAHRGSDMPNARRFGQSCVPKRAIEKASNEGALIPSCRTRAAISPRLLSSTLFGGCHRVIEMRLLARL
jgi:hypothetical protein